jgi:hypothetical protein
VAGVQSVAIAQQPPPAGSGVLVQVPAHVSVVHGSLSLQSAAPAHAQAALTTGVQTWLVHAMVTHAPRPAELQSPGWLQLDSAA